MKISAGTAIIYNKKLLLCHPVNCAWTNSFSLPKGGVDEGETILDAAIRETIEEVGISINPTQISNIDDPIEIMYTNKKGEDFKKVYVYVIRINNLSEIDRLEEIMGESTLQKTEVDWAGFMTKEEALPKIFYRFKPILDLL